MMIELALDDVQARGYMRIPKVWLIGLRERNDLRHQHDYDYREHLLTSVAVQMAERNAVKPYHFDGHQ